MKNAIYEIFLYYIIFIFLTHISRVTAQNFEKICEIEIVNIDKSAIDFLRDIFVLDNLFKKMVHSMVSKMID